MKLLNSIKAQRQSEQRAKLYRDMLRRAAKIGGQLFGQVTPGARREFFCLDQNTWVWHEEWLDNQTGQRRIVTTRYDVRPDGILKAQDNQGYRYIDFNEASNLYQAIRLYNQRLSAELQRAA